MTSFPRTLLLLGLGTLLGYRLRCASEPAPVHPTLSFNAGVARVYFSPRGGAAPALLDAVNNARKSIHLQAYSFTYRPLLEALIQAQRRGVEVAVLLDATLEPDRPNLLSALRQAAIPTRLDDQHTLAHNKVLLIDATSLFTGSYNFTYQADSSNAENLLLLQESPELLTAYEENFQRHWLHSKP